MSAKIAFRVLTSYIQNEHDSGGYMSRKILIPVVVFLLIGSAQAGQIEISPFIGYTFGGGFDVTDVELARINFKSGTSFGVSAGYVFKERFQVEFMWHRQNTQLVGELLELNEEIPLADASLDQYQGNFLYHFGQPENPLRPFVLAGIGASHLDPDDNFDGLTKISYGFGGGIKYFFSPKFGLRLQGRYTPTYISSEDNQVICDPFGCFIGTERNYINQAEFTGGVFFRF
jgi:opacity protein-like surface antigen